ncbi:glucan endo-1,3-beta-D-glucosidase [Polaribacter aestuariivivens]|uniref:Glucan endo-1,3-beta-D-glucosidase n=1 Tax=Polaribacter aestuariivivens TaxID=2304626 RepID=A0A5S3N8R8_9FLAO|nr:glucan endo-1,3-beta-D-glucosidase [Polaribacter aestuariivivens]TMM31502.1 glucan endo-1,3-beta-D-glucosidase [Polaribacter aestuariivivens]
MKKIKNLYIILFSLTIGFYGCQENDYEFGEIVAPSNIVITANIVGADSNNPNGDGSGVVSFKATADNAVSYQYIFNGNTNVATSGEYTYSFSTLGLNTYTVTVVATGIAGTSSSNSIQVDVLSTYSPPQELLDKLYGTGSKTWKIQSAKPGHFGLGSVGGPMNEFYGAGPNEKAGVGMYDDRYIFNSDGTFTHITDSTNDATGLNTDGTIFGRDPYIIDDLGSTNVSPNGADIENYVYSDYTATFSLTAPGGVETINLTGIGFIGYYTGGSHSYQIVDRGVPNELVLKTTDGNGQFDWWFIIVSE